MKKKCTPKSKMPMKPGKGMKSPKGKKRPY